eukprot:gnl/TRDRNA2_/TRDRNA2_199535_c0_seq1.p1 gnl/TRDRNA2_/TRDRNA2_199535_c0~~gnl/TRDRNA2_/TRDRNA2_199535_c0_seq1.p1  ORF type:complete len:344 (-),score=44.46 gnl/TRDRNA2_/TRDRNA2_199535_c0_seq1:50-1081(-)
MHRYVACRQIGRGAGGDVVLADAADGHVVLKCVLIAGLPAQRRRRVLREVLVLHRLSHPNVVRLRDAFLHHQHLVVVSEFCDAGDLEALIWRRRELVHRDNAMGTRGFSEPSTLGVLVQLARALQYIHGKAVVHRDLKASNVFLTQRGVARLGDFGVASSTGDSRLQLTAAEEGAQVCGDLCQKKQHLVGSIHHWSPEVCDGEPHTAAGDCWALGVLLYELCTLELPFSGSNALAVAMRIAEGRPAEPMPDSYSEDLRGICAALLQVDAKRRLTASRLLGHPILRAAEKAPETPKKPAVTSRADALKLLELERPLAQLAGPAEYERFMFKQLEAREGRDRKDV